MGNQFCPHCGAEIKVSSEEEFEIISSASVFPEQLKVPLISMILSTFYPGLGQIYNGDSLAKGLAFFFGCVFGSFLFLIPGLIIWIYGMYDAYSVAQKMNKRKIEYKETKNRDLFLIFIITLTFILLLMLFSIYAALQMIGNLNGLLPDTGRLINPEIYNMDYYKNINA